MNTKVRGEISCPLETTKECTGNLLSDLSSWHWGFLRKLFCRICESNCHGVMGDIQQEDVWCGRAPNLPPGALLGGRTMQDLCFSSPVLHARHVACNQPTLLSGIALDIFGDPLLCCPCWDLSKAAEPFLGALPHDPHPFLHSTSPWYWREKLRSLQC